MSHNHSHRYIWYFDHPSRFRTGHKDCSQYHRGHYRRHSSKNHRHRVGADANHELVVLPVHVGETRMRGAKEFQNTCLCRRNRKCFVANFVLSFLGRKEINILRFITYKGHLQGLASRPQFQFIPFCSVVHSWRCKTD
jgi:hypothetical protein